jgi:exopolyphosphatase/guanosine-5'-triphosphate,3'-diphosphate pyrophosphatase
LSNAELPGFSQEEHLQIVMLVRTQRRKFNAELFAALPPIWRTKTIQLSVLLRLAIILNRNRNKERPAVTVQAREQKLMVYFPKDWLTARPLLAADLLQEREALAQYHWEFDIREERRTKQRTG